MSPDETVYTFKLRQGVKFHDGTEFDSEDVLFTFEYLTGAREGGIYAKQYSPMIKGIDAPDKYTFVVTLNTPWEDFLPLMVNHWEATYYRRMRWRPRVTLTATTRLPWVRARLCSRSGSGATM